MRGFSFRYMRSIVLLCAILIPFPTTAKSLTANLETLFYTNKMPRYKKFLPLEVALNPGAVSLGLENDTPVNRKYPRINMPPNGKALNLYLLPRQTIHDLGLETCGCQAIIDGEMRHVICDARWLTSLARQTVHFLQPLNEYETRAMELAVEMWLVHHEIAHHHLEHRTLDQNQPVSRSENRRLEVRADEVALFADRIEDGKKALVTNALRASDKWRKSGTLKRFYDRFRTSVNGFSESTQTHPSFSVRFTDYLKLLANSTVETQERADEIVAAVFVALSARDACDNTELSVLPSHSALLDSFFLATPKERGRMHRLLENAIPDASDSDTEGILTYVLALCQAKLLANNDEFCGISADTVAATSDLTRLLLAQNLLIQKSQQTVEEARQHVRSMAEGYLTPLYQSFSGSNGGKAYTFLALKTLGYPFATCGPAGFGHSLQVGIKCKDHAKAVANELQLESGEGLPNINLLVNLILALDVKDNGERLAILDLLAIFAVQELNEIYAPIILEFLDDNEKEFLKFGVGGFLALVFINHELGQYDKVYSLFGRHRHLVSIDSLDPLVFVNTNYELARLCRAFYAPSCALDFHTANLKVARDYADTPTLIAENFEKYTNFVEMIEYERGTMLVWLGHLKEGLAILMGQVSNEDNPWELAETWETIAEAHIWRGDGKAAQTAMKKALAARASQKRLQSEESRYETLSYLTATAFLNDDREEFIARADEMGALFRKMNGTNETLVGVGSKFAIRVKNSSIFRNVDHYKGELDESSTNVFEYRLGVCAVGNSVVFLNHFHPFDRCNGRRREKHRFFGSDGLDCSSSRSWNFPG